MKKFEILQELSNATKRHEVNKCCWENCADRLTLCRIAPTLQFAKNAVSSKYNKV